MRIQVLGAHNCESKETGFATLLIDDILALEAGGLASSLSFEAQMNLEAILITHHHYDHIRDIPALAMNALLRNRHINVYCSPLVIDALTTHLINDDLYPDFRSKAPEHPAIRFTELQSGVAVTVSGYHVLPVPVRHSLPAFGYQITAPDGKKVFYTGDTGGGLEDCWRAVAPDLLIAEVTGPGRWQEFLDRVGHLSPGRLKQELESFREIKGYLPPVVTVHMNPADEDEIKTELAPVAAALGVAITPAYEGMVVEL